MLRKIFLRKAKEASLQVDSAERFLDETFKKVEELKKRSSFSFLREEIISNIYQSNHFSLKIHDGFRDGCTDNDSYKRLDATLKSIEECLDEMEKLKDSSPHVNETQIKECLKIDTLGGCYGK